MLFTDHLLQEMDTRLLVAQTHYVAQYLTPRQGVTLTNVGHFGKGHFGPRHLDHIHFGNKTF